MVYGNQVLFPIEIHIKTYKIIAEVAMDLTKAQKESVVQLNELDEMRLEATSMYYLNLETKSYMESHIYQVGDQALLYDFKFKDFKGKFTTYWLGPSEIESIYENGSMKVKTIDDLGASLLVNRQRLKLYQWTKYKE